MGYYRRYYTQRDYAVTKVAIKSAGGNGIECIFFEDHGEKMIIDNKYVTVGSDNMIVTEDSVMVEDNTDTLTECPCGRCDDPDSYTDDINKTRQDLKSEDVRVRANAQAKLTRGLDIAKTLPKSKKNALLIDL